MKMKAADRSKYPKFAYYVRVNIPILVRNPVIVHNMKTNGNFTDAEVAEVLKWDSGPFIKIQDLGHGQCGVPAAYGCTRGSTEVEVDEDTVKAFESGPRAGMVGQNARGGSVYVVGVTLLHELCHLGKFRHKIGETTEAGFGFESGAYGKSVP
jgi:hypothetical protein